MFKVAATTDVAAPPEAVWTVLEDVDRYPEISSPTQRMLEVPAGDLEVGYRYREYGGIPPFEDESTWTVAEYEPYRRQVHVGDDGSSKLDLVIEIQVTDEGCRVHQSVIMRPRWYTFVPSAILWPIMMRRRAQEAVTETVENIGHAAEEVG